MLRRLRWLLKYKFRDARNSGTLCEKRCIYFGFRCKFHLFPPPILLFLSLSLSLSPSLPLFFRLSTFLLQRFFSLPFQFAPFFNRSVSFSSFIPSFTPFFVSSMSMESRLAVLIRFYSPKRMDGIRGNN